MNIRAEDPALVARERGISRPALVDLLRDAVGSLASRYELLASAPLNERPAVSRRVALAGKCGYSTALHKAGGAPRDATVPLLHVFLAMPCRAALVACWALPRWAVPLDCAPSGCVLRAVPLWVLASVAAVAVLRRALRLLTGRGPSLSMVRLVHRPVNGRRPLRYPTL